MKLKGGFLPRIEGRPSSLVEEVTLSEKLYIQLERGSLKYNPVAHNSQYVEAGQPLAEAEVEGGVLTLPSPVSGTVFVDEQKDIPAVLVVLPDKSGVKSEKKNIKKSDQMSGEEIRELLSRAGLWPFFWSSRTNGTPSLVNDIPRSIVVNFLITEPFRTRGKVVLERNYRAVIEGIKYLNCLLADYGTIEIVLTSPHDPLARKIYKDLAGHAWIKFHPIPLRYPVENQRLLDYTLRKSSSGYVKDDVIWIIDAQGIKAVGEYLAEGKSLEKRIITVGGPGCANPRHLSVTIGTPIRDIVADGLGDLTILRGGIFKGECINRDTNYICYDDDAFFFLPNVKKREPLSFLRVGFNKYSYLPAFGANILRRTDSQLSSLLRGEPRPCIACGLCENICPVELLPQLLHRYLYHDELDDAEKMGLNRCIDCNLCTYVCPSKIELQKQFAEAKDKLQAEHDEAAEILAR